MTTRWEPYRAYYAAVRAGLAGGGRPRDYAQAGAEAALAVVEEGQLDELTDLIARGLELLPILPDREPDASRAGWPAPRWVCCSRVEDAGSGMPEREWLSPEELAQAALTFRSAVRRVSVVAGAMPEGGPYTDPHYGSTDLPPMGRVLDVDFDGLHLWALVQSRVDDDAKLSRMDALVDEGYTGLSIGLHPESEEVRGDDGPLAQLIHVAMVSESGFPRVAALPPLDEQGFGMAALADLGWPGEAEGGDEQTPEMLAAARSDLLNRVKAREALMQRLKMRAGEGTPSGDPPPDDTKTPTEPDGKTRAGDDALAKALESVATAVAANTAAVTELRAQLAPKEPDDTKDRAGDDKPKDDAEAEKLTAGEEKEVEEAVDAAVRAGFILPVKAAAVATALKGVPRSALPAVRAIAVGQKVRPIEVQVGEDATVRVDPHDARFRAGGGEVDLHGLAIVNRAETRLRERGHEGPVSHRQLADEYDRMRKEGAA
jgi:hypothetical protein